MKCMHAVHPSFVGRRRVPEGFGSVAGDGVAEFSQAQALDVFSRMTSSGYTFVETLGAVYVTGIHDGVNDYIEEG